MDEADWRPSSRSWGPEEFETGEGRSRRSSRGLETPEATEVPEPRSRPDDVPPAGA
jgi:hypothetical protein